MIYHRPRTLEEALALLKKATPLGGGTSLTPRRRELGEVIDLQAAGLDQIESRAGELRLGAGIKLQALLESAESVPEVLRQTVRLEAGWNLRNQATVGGAVVSGDGRSPLLAALLALDARVHLEPGGTESELDAFLDSRSEAVAAQIITHLDVHQPKMSQYAQVARSPADLPIVCAAVCTGIEPRTIRIALGGYANRPIRLRQAEAALAKVLPSNEVSKSEAEAAVLAAGAAAEDAYREAGDRWASGEYRGEIAAVLVGRLLRKVLT